MVGIISYGIYVPKLRLKIGDIASVWGKKEEHIIDSLGISEKSVAGYDEDAVSMGFEAASKAISYIGFDPKKIGAVFVGSESHPYAVNPTSTIVAEFLGISNNYFSSDLEFACKAATTGLIIASSLVSENKINYGLVIGTDCAQAKPHDVLEYAAASAGAAYVLSNNKSEIIAEIVDFCSFSSDTPDFWRRDGTSYPSHGGRFTTGPGYFNHVLNSSKTLLEKTKLKASDFDYCIFHMPNNKFPKSVALKLGFTAEQLKPSLTVEKIGNPYSASSLIGLSSVLEIAKPNKLIFFASYGSGAGSDGIIFKTTTNITRFQKKGISFEKETSQKKYISYVEYLKARGVI